MRRGQLSVRGAELRALAGAAAVSAAVVAVAMATTDRADGQARHAQAVRPAITAPPATASPPEPVEPTGSPEPSASPGLGEPVAESRKPQATGPAIEGNFPDPDVLRVGETYYAYATNARGRNVPVATAPSIDGPWRVQPGDALPELGRWARSGNTWAPEVVRRPDGVFVLYYTAESRTSGDQCIGVATSQSPTGPFQPVGDRPLVCSEEGDAIDAAFFRDRDGSAHLLYRKDIAGPRPTAIFIRPLGPRWLSFTGPATRILTWDDSDPVLVEAPALVRRGDKYVLLYSAGVFYSDRYRTRYAIAAERTGPYRRAPEPLMSSTSFGRKIVGPGGADIVADPAGDHIVFHGITDFLGGERVRRAMYVADLGWDGAHPVVRGSRRRYEAEAGTAAGGRVVSGKGASGGRAVRIRPGAPGGLEIRVPAPEAGVYTVRLTYRTVRGKTGEGRLVARPESGAAGMLGLRLDYRKSSRWRTVTVEVALARGWNTLTFTQQGAPIDIDHLEVS